MKPLYTATALATSGRDGKVLSDDAKIDLPLSLPRELGGPGGDGTNPEQLFAAGYAACFGSALKLVASKQKITTGPVTIHAKVSIGMTEGGFGLSVALVGELPEVPREVGEALLKAAHEVCPYSRATRGNIDVTLSLK
jgi:Ohr subfamily peroxiredoxin